MSGPDDWTYKCEHWRTLALEHYEPFSEAKCNQILQESLDTIKTHNHPNESKETGVAGWRDAVQLDDDGLSVRVTTRKTLHGDMKQLVDHSWEHYVDGDKLKESHHTDQTQIFHQILQQVSSDLVIVQRVEKLPDLVQLTHAVGIIFRVQTETGHMIVSRCIESPPLQSLMKAEGLSLDRSFLWSTFEATQGDAIQFTVAGSIGSDDPTYAKHWSDELLAAVVRYEAQLKDTSIVSNDKATEVARAS